MAPSKLQRLSAAGIAGGALLIAGCYAIEERDVLDGFEARPELTPGVVAPGTLCEPAAIDLACRGEWMCERSSAAGAGESVRCHDGMASFGSNGGAFAPAPRTIPWHDCDAFQTGFGLPGDACEVATLGCMVVDNGTCRAAIVCEPTEAGLGTVVYERFCRFD